LINLLVKIGKKNGLKREISVNPLFSCGNLEKSPECVILIGKSGSKI
jgi:hypothetical protein